MTTSLHDGKSPLVKPATSILVAITWAVIGLSSPVLAQDQAAIALPNGVKAVWDLAKATRESTPTRARVSLNGLWRWQPAEGANEKVPESTWGYYKVPASWPGIQDYMQSDYQTLYPHPSWKTVNLGELRSAWYQRTLTVPEDWVGQRIALQAEYLNSYATVLIDGRQVGELRFPGGEINLTDAVRPGSTHVVSLLVVAMPLKAVMESYSDTNAARQRKGAVERRGLCGDVWLVSEPAGARLAYGTVAPSVRRSQVTFSAQPRGLTPERQYQLRARLSEGGQLLTEFTGPKFSSLDVTNGRVQFTADWKPPKLWDIHTPDNQYTVELSLLDGHEGVLDTMLPVRFGFREFWSEGRDFWLNGTRLYLSLVPLDNAQVGAALATYSAAKESFLRLKSFGINFVYTHNYGCEPGSHLSFTEILQAADDTGMLVALSQPHFSAYDWKSADADRTNGYATHAAFYTQVAANHPSVVSYAMSHNATGYNEDMNPMRMDGQGNPRDQWASRNAALALRCEAIVRGLDPSRLIYHHSSGSLSGMYTINFYPNFAPIQELDDWFEHWSSAGLTPMLLVEYGAPFGWDWAMYRGWSKGRREFGSAVVPWEYCLAEWNAQLLGPEAYQISEREKRNLRWEAEQFRQHRPGWHRWDYPYPIGDRRLEELQPVQAAYTTANWRAFRTWGLSGNSPWEHDRFWSVRDGFEHHRQELPVDWERLQRPGYSPDFIDRTYARFDLAYERSDWVASPTARSLQTNNLPLLTWIAGKAAHFTSKDHIFYPGETVEKQLIVINNSRVTVTGDASWICNANRSLKGTERITVPTGEQERVPLHLVLPADAAPGDYELQAHFETRTGEQEQDSFRFQVVPRPAPLRCTSRIALFDPEGSTGQWLTARGISCTAVDDRTDLSDFDVLVIGRRALTVDGAGPKLERVRAGLRVIVFEQTTEVLEQRLGFRVAEYGLRQAFPRVPDSPLLAGLKAENLRDWRGASTLLPVQSSYALSPRYNGAPTVRWCGLEVTRLWRCGNWGNVASVLIEKPSRGDFLPIVEGGYALQYSPLLEYREGRGMILFCQMDVTARSESDPAAEILAENIFRYVDAWSPPPERTAVYAGNAAGLEWLEACGIRAGSYKGAPLTMDQVLVVGPGGDRELGQAGATISSWIKTGGHVLALGLGQDEANSFLPAPIATRTTEHISTYFPAFSVQSPLAGVAPADLHNRAPRNVPLVVGGATCYGDGVLASTDNVVFCQLPSFQLSEPMRPPDEEPLNLRRTFVRTSFALSRLLANLGVRGPTPLLERFGSPVVAPLTASQVQARADSPPREARWLEGLYLTRPTEWDDPYRFFRW